MSRISQVERLRKVKGGVGSQARRGTRKINGDSCWSEKDWAQLSIANGAVVTQSAGVCYTMQSFPGTPCFHSPPIIKTHSET